MRSLGVVAAAGPRLQITQANQVAVLNSTHFTYLPDEATAELELFKNS